MVNNKEARLYRHEDFERDRLASLREVAAKQGLFSIEDFRAYMPMHEYIFVPSRELWPASSVNARVATPENRPERS